MSTEDIILKLDLCECCDPTLLYQQAREHNLNLSHWFRKPNSFFLPKGRGPGVGWVLLQKSDADDLDLDVQHNLTIGAIPNEGAPTSFQVVIYDLYVTDVITLYTDDMLSPSDQSVRLIKLEDVRHVLFQTTLNKSYNIRDFVTGQYQPTTLNSDTPYTWQEILDDIWDDYFLAITGENCPTLPSVPDYPPEGFIFHNISAWEAWNQVVEASGCVVIYDPTQIALPRFSITSLKGIRVITWPESKRGRASTVPEHGSTCYPTTISVFFPGVGAAAPDQIAYRKDVASGIPGASPDVTHTLWFPRYAIYNTGTDPDNKAELDVLAADVAEKYSDQFIVPGGATYTAYDFKRLYFGTFTAIIPNRLVDSVHWRDFGDQSGLSTEYRGGFIDPVWVPVCMFGYGDIIWAFELGEELEQWDELPTGACKRDWDSDMHGGYGGYYTVGSRPEESPIHFLVADWRQIGYFGPQGHYGAAIMRTCKNGLIGVICDLQCPPECICGDDSDFYGYCSYSYNHGI